MVCSILFFSFSSLLLCYCCQMPGAVRAKFIRRCLCVLVVCGCFSYVNSALFVDVLQCSMSKRYINATHVYTNTRITVFVMWKISKSRGALSTNLHTHTHIHTRMNKIFNSTRYSFLFLPADFFLSLFSFLCFLPILPLSMRLFKNCVQKEYYNSLQIFT